MTTVNHAEQISAYEARRASSVAAMEAVMAKAAGEGSTLDKEQQETYDTHADEVEVIDKHLDRLRTLEKIKASTAKAVSPKIETPQAASEARIPGTVKATPKSLPGIELTRLIIARTLAKLDGEYTPKDLAHSRWGENSLTYGILHQKAPIGAGTTASGTWAGNLVSDDGGVFADFVEWLRPQTILGKFGTDGVPSLRRVPFRRALVSQSSGGQGYWVGEGLPKPLTKFDFTRTTLEPLKVANIAVITEELIRDSSPSAEMLVRDGLAAALRERLDTDFIDPDKTASSGVSPASITNGITPTNSSGDDAEAVREDIKTLFAGFIASNNPPTTGVWIMSATTALALSLMTNALGQAEFPGITMMGGSLFGLPVIVSEYVPSDSNGHFVILMNAGDVYLADEGGIRIDMSREASLQMNSEPTTQDATTGTGTSLVSLWQTNTVGFLAERTINWALRRAEAVQVLDAVNWGDPSA